uniref:Uncharacterized protein n=1 Tax=Trichobilharzia regenti TaxID=157069 RepID=A0AA85J4H5_TRIRE|nr:unnamed protein product [Trichobilharzia regenti]
MAVHTRCSCFPIDKTLEIIPHLESAEDATRGMKELLHRLNPNSRVELDNHIDCLEAAHTYNWGVIVFDSLVKRLLRYRDVNLADVVNCCKEEASAYREKVKEFPLKNCFENLPSASRQNLDVLNSAIKQVAEYRGVYGMSIFLENLYTTHITRGQ